MHLSLSFQRNKDRRVFKGKVAAILEHHEIETVSNRENGLRVPTYDNENDENGRGIDVMIRKVFARGGLRIT